MALTAIAAFWVVALLLIAVPGPDWAFTLATTLHGQPLIAAVAGLVVGYTTLTAVVSAGIGALVAGTPAAMTALTLLGGAYLIWQGIGVLRRPSVAEATMSSAASTPRATIVKGIGVSGLNPKALLLFLALLPQFTDPHGGWPLAAQLALLGAVFTFSCGAFYLLLGTFAAYALGARPAAARALSGLSGGGMLVVGLLLVVERMAAR